MSRPAFAFSTQEFEISYSLVDGMLEVSILVAL